MNVQLHMIRPAIVGDGGFLARLRAASLSELQLLEPGCAATFETDAERAFEGLLARDEIVARLLVVGGDVVGSACVMFWHRLPYATTSLHGELAGVYVARAHRRRGFARRLCGEVLAAAHKRNVRRVVVHPSPAGRALYAGLGFVPSGELRLGTSEGGYAVHSCGAPGLEVDISKITT